MDTEEVVRAIRSDLNTLTVAFNKLYTKVEVMATKQAALMERRVWWQQLNAALIAVFGVLGVSAVAGFSVWIVKSIGV